MSLTINMSTDLGLILIVGLVAALVQWRRCNFKSYQIAKLVGMWIIPPILCFGLGWDRFIVIWSIFCTITAYVAFRATRQPVAGTTPRLVYNWFLLVNKVSCGTGVAGLSLLLMTLFGLADLVLDEETSRDLGSILLFYALYLGIISRDFAEICVDKMTSCVGYYTANGLPSLKLEPYVCALCGEEVIIMNNSEALIGRSLRLRCDHIFHEFCIRGWCFVGKKQTCPYCKENVDLKRMFPSPWERRHMLYGQLLDVCCFRCLFGWQLVIFVAVQLIY